MDKIKIFVILGSQRFQFNRLLIELDRLPKDKYSIFAQIGYSNYKPKNYEYIDFLSREDFLKRIQDSQLVITHAGTGAIISALNLKKIVLAIPRLKKYKEHVDNHQLEILNTFKEKNYISGVVEIDNFEQEIMKALDKKYDSFVSNTEVFIEKIISLIEA